ncbi:MAG: FtsQ-type POTRA domain-containing protein, partial [Acidobacteriaceae bacterium]
ESSDSIETGRLEHVTRSQVLEVFGGDIGRNIFFVPLAVRQKQLEAAPWIKSAMVMRFLPNRLRVEVKERTPMAFVQIGSTTGLIDESGVVMPMPIATGPGTIKDDFSFPVITGLHSAEPLSVRAASMKIFARLEQELNANGAAYMNDVSEVDLSDPQDVRIVVGDNDGTVLVHLGSRDFERRYRFYLEHIKSWRQQYHVRSIDLRYDGQVIVNREGQVTGK